MISKRCDKKDKKASNQNTDSQSGGLIGSDCFFRFDHAKSQSKSTVFYRQILLNRTLRFNIITIINDEKIWMVILNDVCN